ncbi:MAG: hypothetical protein RB191_05480 [Terriglobia bacterium]|nr:hypothetical protein [Terriglobia bacterium]
MRNFADILKCHLRLLGLIVGIGIVVAVSIYIFTPRTYTAVAVLGPPGPSPSEAMIASIGHNSSLAGLAGKVLGGGGTSANDPYQDLQQLLPSSRLSQVLIERDHILQTLFYRQWDFRTNRWKAPGAIASLKNSIKSELGLPVTEHPDVDSLILYFDNHLTVGPADHAPGGMLGGVNPYNKVTFRYGNRLEAEKLLNLILSEADEIIRENQRQNVTSRIAILREELSHQDATADERSALIAVLAGQEQVQAVIEADQRYASTLIVPPYASSQPVSPPGLLTLFIDVMFGAVFTWVGIVWLSIYFRGVHRFIAWSRRHSADVRNPSF